jgi:hypothetical protein
MRAVAAYALASTSLIPRIEPVHRKALLELLHTSEFSNTCIADWSVPPGSFQTSANALYTGQLKAGWVIKCWLQLPTMSAPTIRIIADIYINDLDHARTWDWPLSLEDLIRSWADLLRLVGISAEEQVVRLLSDPQPIETSVELHAEAAQETGSTLGTCLDLSPLGEPTRQLPLQAMWVGPAAHLKTLGPTNMALDALRDNALDWGFLDPDPGIDSIRRALLEAGLA